MTYMPIIYLHIKCLVIVTYISKKEAILVFFLDMLDILLVIFSLE